MREFYARFFNQIRDEAYAVVVAEDGERGLDILQHEPVDLVLLDWSLPGISGEAFLRALRAHPKTRSISVLMVTGKSTPTDEIQALDSGADDYLAKPFEADELLARLRSLSRWRELAISRQEMSRFPGLEFDLDAALVTVEGRRVHLTSKEAGLLGIFVRRPNSIHSHAHLWETLWGYESERWEHLLVVAMSSLRGKLGTEWGSRLKSHEGKGYAFESPL